MDKKVTYAEAILVEEIKAVKAFDALKALIGASSWPGTEAAA